MSEGEERERTEQEPGSQPESGEGEGSSELSEQVPDKLSGEGGTPLGATDQHSDAPGPHGLGEEDSAPQ